MWVRGLKQDDAYDVRDDREVAPRVGAWIETFGKRRLLRRKEGRTPCGCVD